MADLTGTGTVSSPQLGNVREVIVTFADPVANNDTYDVAGFSTVLGAIFVPTTTGADPGLSISGKTVTFSLAASRTGKLYIRVP